MTSIAQSLTALLGSDCPLSTLSFQFRARRWLPRALILLLIILAPFWTGYSAADGGFERGLQYAVGNDAFSLTSWEGQAIAERIGRLIAPSWSPGANPALDKALVERYAALTADLNRARSSNEKMYATRSLISPGDSASDLDKSITELTKQRDALRPAVEPIIAYQIESVLRDEGIRDTTVSLTSGPGLLNLTLGITPGVSFRLGPPPDLLVLAPRDRIEVIGSLLIQPGLTLRQSEALEASADANLGASSLATPIGGLAAYPAMVPPGSNVQQLLKTISHEWVHHYLAFRPLGSTYFTGYDMRTINETTADIIGNEVGDKVYYRYYSERTAGAPAPSRTTGPTFGERMRAIRTEVEPMLARGDIAEAEATMEKRRQELVGDGYAIRKLNTAFLSFYGAYTGVANPYESQLRKLREEAGSLKAFAERVSQITSPSDLDR